MLILLTLYALYLLLLFLMAYEDYRYTIVSDKLVFAYLLLSGIILAIYEQKWLYIVFWSIYVLLLYLLYKRFEARELLYPYLAIGLSIAFSLIDFLEGTPYFILVTSFLSFGVLLYYLKFWALGDIFAYLGSSLALAPLIFSVQSFSEKLGFLGLILTKLPIQLQMLIFLTLGYVPYIFALGVVKKLKTRKGIYALVFEFLFIFSIYTFIELSSSIIPAFEAFILAFIVGLAAFYFFETTKSLKLSLLVVSLAAAGAVAGIVIKHLSLFDILVNSLIIMVLSEFIDSLRDLSGKRYIKVEELSDGDIAGFYLVRTADGSYRYLEDPRELEKLEAAEILVRAKNPNGLYPEQIELLKSLAKQKIVPEYVPIYKGLPMLPAFLFGNLIVVLILLRNLI